MKEHVQVLMQPNLLLVLSAILHIVLPIFPISSLLKNFQFSDGCYGPYDLPLAMYLLRLSTEGLPNPRWAKWLSRPRTSRPQTPKLR